MSMKPGMSYRQLKKQELEKGAFKDAAMGAALAATVAAAGVAHEEVGQSKAMMQPQSASMTTTDHPVDTAHTELPDPAKGKLDQSAQKVKSFRDRLTDIRNKLKGEPTKPKLDITPVKE